jgi:anti-sigma B factor antagonist
MGDEQTSGDMAMLRVARQVGANESILELSGEVDMSNAQQLEEALAAALEATDERLVVDLGGLEFIDSTGLRSLLRFHQLDHAETEVVFRNAGGQVAEVLEITGLGSVLELEAD